MKKIKTLSAAILSLAIISCSKSKTDVPVPVVAGDKQLKEGVYTAPDGSVSKETMTYDVKGNLKTYTDDAHAYEFFYESANSLKVVRKKIGETVADQEVICTLNEKGAATKLVYKTMPANTDAYTYELTYDANGYPVVVKGYSSSGNVYEEKFEIVNGNAVSSQIYSNGTLYDSRFYSYDLAVENKRPFSNWYSWPSRTLFGKPTRNLMTEVKNFNQAGPLTWHIKYSYQLDNAGYPLKMTTDYIHNGKKSFTDYIFQ